MSSNAIIPYIIRVRYRNGKEWEHSQYTPRDATACYEYCKELVKQRGGGLVELYLKERRLQGVATW